MSRRHSKPVRGLTAFETGNDPAKSGRFGRLFPPDDQQLPLPTLKELASTMIGDGPDEDNSVVEDDEEDENRDPLTPGGPLRLTSGYTYFGQFIDHDLTFDPVSSLDAQIDPDALIDFRTPRLDLDCVYGAGPDDQPYLYEADGEKLIEGIGGDVLRLNGRAVIGDPRNDENRIVVQIQHLFIRFHNVIVDHLKHSGTTDGRFRKAQTLVRRTYQWLIVHDFLRRILKDGAWDGILAKSKTPGGGIFHHKILNSYDEPFMPVEFAGAAYRFGHSMVRPSYHLNDSEVRLRDGGLGAKGGNRVPIFDLSEPNLNGFRPLLLPGATVPLIIEWKYFLHFVDGEGEPPQAHDRTANVSHDVVQPAYRIDTSLTEPLANLVIPHVVGAGSPPNLAERNLTRSMRLRLPSGQKVAAALGLTPLTKQQLLLETAATAPTDPYELRNHEIATDRITKLGNQAVAAVAAATPLWYYMLAEAQTQEHSASLGALGSLLVGNVFLELLLADKESILHVHGGFHPTAALHLPAGMKLETLADLVFIAQPETIGRFGVLQV